MFGDLLHFIRREVKGPKLAVVLFTALVGIKHGLLLAIINEAVEEASAGTVAPILAMGFVLMLVLYLGAGYYAFSRSIRLVTQLTEGLRLRLCEKLFDSNLQLIEEQGKGEIYSQLTRDVNQLSSSILRVLEAFQAVVLVFFCLLYIGWLSWPGLVATCVAILLGVMAYRVQDAHAERLLRSTRAREADFFDGISDLLDGFKELKMTSLRARGLHKELWETADEFRELTTRTEIRFSISLLTSQSFMFALLGVVVFLYPEAFATDSIALYKFLAAVLFMLGPLEVAVDSLPSIIRGRVSLEQILKLEARLDSGLHNARISGGDAVRSLPMAPLRLDGLRYRFGEEGGFELGPVTLTIEPGSIIFIVGGNGSGKTTLLKLITGLYQPNSGQIYLGDQVIHEDTYPAYRELFSQVFWDFHLFRRLHGLMVGEPAVESWLERLGLARKIRFSKDGFTKLNLSTGERKRLAFLVARLYDREIFLFDELTADQDPHYRRYFYETLLPELKHQGKTVIAVTHDDAWFHACDRLLKMDYGRLTELPVSSSW
uniref:Putative ATP-binding cassette transporter n=1 Tax=Candidatus Kentrum sp. FW TaxID=2126338 RepID=A0A450T0E4_9GAMM|nr:MAG: putative ATP-binding cassette transporter [Candidatus Kentron sp. FW]